MQFTVEEVTPGSDFMVLKTPVGERMIPLDAVSVQIQAGDTVTVKGDVLVTDYGETKVFEEW